jgi:NADH dehydrogenase/NADH:ubiquinone oxidoreductase subunit G
MISLKIDGKEVKVKKGTTILLAARKIGVEIPTLCYHEALSPIGACRLCTVEIKRGKRTKVVTACNFSVEDEVEVQTNSPRVKKIRKMVLELLWARCPDVKRLQELAEQMDITQPRFTKEKSDCILCGLCVRVCSEIIGANAITFVDRGVEREVATPFKVSSDECLGCGACVALCPTGAIKMEDIENSRVLDKWNTTCKLSKCKVCSAPFAPWKQLEYIRGRIDLPAELFEICPRCRRKTFALEEEIAEMQETSGRKK